MIDNFLNSLNSPEYLPWEKVKYKPLPTGFTPELIWDLLKTKRKISLTKPRFEIIKLVNIFLG